ncbi:MAG: hypothetical protein AAF502_18860 [Bacteroidota bacterium]
MKREFVYSFLGLTLIWVDIHFKLPNNILIKIDFFNDVIGAIIFFWSTPVLKEKPDSGLGIWELIGLFFIMFGIIDFGNLQALNSISILPNIAALILWIVILNIIIRKYGDDLKSLDAFIWQRFESLFFFGLGFFVFLIPSITNLNVTHSWGSFILFILIVILIYCIPYLRIRRLIITESNLRIPVHMSFDDSEE